MRWWIFHLIYCDNNFLMCLSSTIYLQYSGNRSESRSVASESLRPRGLYGPWNSPGQKTGVGSLSLLQWIFPAWGSNPGLLHCRWILYQLSHKGSPSVKDVHIFKRRRNGVKLRELEKRLCVESWVSEPANFWTDFKLSVRTELVGLVRS